MLEIPGLLYEFIKNMLFDFDYFADFMVNGGWVLTLFIFFVVLMIFGWLSGEIGKVKNKFNK